MDKKSIKVLLIGGKPEGTSLPPTISSGADCIDVAWTHAPRLGEACQRLSEDRFDAILLDFALPDSQPPEALVQIQSRAANVPLILLVDSTDQAAAAQAVQKGVQDYLLKHEIDGQRLTHSILCAMERHRFLEEIIQTHQRIVGPQTSLDDEDRFNLLLKVAGTTAHELKQPLTVLLGNIELMKISDQNSEELKGHITEIETAGKRISNIVSKMQQIRYENAIAAMEGPLLLQFNEPKNVLSVEDTDKDFQIIEHCLKDEKYLPVTRARSFKEAFPLLEHQRFDLILLDYLLPDGNALGFMKTMNGKKLEIPVIFVTGQGDEMVAAKAIQAGAYDYLTKEKINKSSLLRAITYTLEKARLLKEISQIQKKIVEMSIQDELTGLYNRRYMEEMLEIEFSRARTYKTDLSCLIMDLDHFKQVNDTFGHAFGDFVLKEFALCLKNSTRNTDWRFRYGGEEFMLLVPSTDIHNAQRIAEKLRQIYAEKTFSNDGHSITVTVSIGVASKNQHRPDRWEDLMGYADKALYDAKNSGRNCVKVYTQ